MPGNQFNSETSFPFAGPRCQVRTRSQALSHFYYIWHHFGQGASYKRVQQPVTGREERGILAESERREGEGAGGGGSNRLQQSFIDGRDGLWDGAG